MLAAMKLVVIFAALAAANGATNEDLVKDNKVVEGRPIPVTDAKYMVQIIITLPNKHFGCSAFLVDPSLVVTAGHCVSDINDAAALAQLELVVGSTLLKDPKKEGQVFSAKAFARHKKFRLVTVKSGGTYGFFDVAAIRLNGTAQLGPKVGLIGLPEPGKEAKAGTQLFLAGWGIHKVQKLEVSRKLRRGLYTVSDRNACIKELGQDAVVPEEFCGTGQGKTAFCGGDSGSAVTDLKQKVAYGIVSSGACIPMVMNTFTNIAHPEILDFIKYQMKHL